MDQIEQCEKIKDAPLCDRMRWAAAMNQHGVTDDFPIKMPDVPDYLQHRDPVWLAASRALDKSVTYPQWSLGWWLYALNRSAEEWKARWDARGTQGIQPVASADEVIQQWRDSLPPEGA